MKYLNLILCCLFIQSCSDCTNVYFTENDKTWFVNYDVGDKLIFKSQYNDYDTILITNKILKEPQGECKPFVSNFDKEYARVDYQIKKDTFEIVKGYLIQINANEELEDSSPVIRFLDLEYSNYDNILPKTEQSELNTDWKNIYTFNRDNCPYYNTRFGLTEFEWDKVHGLVSYKNENDEKWILLKKE
jgi:hypothetical protein